MDSLTRVLEINWIILYFIYGQVFFVLGLVTGLQWQRRSQLELARSLPWLAAFGIGHGLNEWGYIFVPLQALYLPDATVRLLVIAHLLLLATSFFCLCQFGAELILARWPEQRWLRMIPLAAFSVWAIMVFVRGVWAGDALDTLFVIGEGWSRYMLCFPGALVTSLGLYFQAEQVRATGLPRIPSYLTGAAVAFAVYAVAGGLIVPPAPLGPARVINYAWLEQVTRIPIPVLRSLCGLAMAITVTYSLRVFEIETEQHIAEMEQAQVLAADRERIGRELHDGIVQNIYAAGLGLEDAQHQIGENPAKADEQITSVMVALKRTMQDIRNYVFDLRIAEQTLALETILEDLIQDLHFDAKSTVSLQVHGERCCWLSPMQLSHITQITREALSNVAQHAEASHVQLTLSYMDQATRVVVADNGRGMDLDCLDNGDCRGQGMTNIQDRADLLGAELIFESEPGQGSTLTLTLPCGNAVPVG